MLTGRKDELCRTPATYHESMLPKTSLRAERTISRLAARTHPPRPTPLQPRDKRTHYELRHMTPRYDVQMSHSHDKLERREADMSTWLGSVAQEKKRLYGWSTDETIAQSSIDRATWYRWKKISKPGNMPRPQKLDEFCESLGLDPEVPYGILGWGRPSVRVQPPEVPQEPETGIARRKRLIQARLDQQPPAEERRELEIALVQIEAAERMQDAADAAADKALERSRRSA